MNGSKIARMKSALERRQKDVKKYQDKKDELKLKIAERDVINLKQKLGAS